MTPEDVKTFYRTFYNFRKQTGMSINTIKRWLEKGLVPELYQYRLERETKGILKADYFGRGDK